MGVLVFAEESHVHEHMSIGENKIVVISAGSCASGSSSNDNNSNKNTGVVWENKIYETPPAPKKKWIQHYLHEEYPHEINKRNGNSIFRESPVISRAPSIIHHTETQHHHQIVHQNNHNNTTHQTFIDNNNVNHAQAGAGSTGSLIIDVDQTQDNKKNKNGPCVIRSGTREVHNKLEKNRRAHLKECFEILKKQLPAQDEKKSSNLSILHAAITHIKMLKKKEREYEHEMERLARERISSQQRLTQLKKELSSKWEHIDFNKLLPEQISTVDSIVNKNVTENMDVDVTTLARDGTIYSSTSSLSSSSITASSPQNHQTSTTSSMHSQVSTAAVVCQTQGLNLANNINNNHNNNNNNNSNNNNTNSSINIINNSNNSCNISNNNNLRESPNSSPGSTITSIPTSAQDKLNNSNVHQIHLPLNAQVINTNHQNIATIMPALQHLGPGIRVIQGDRQLLVTHPGNNEPRPLTIAVQNSNDQTTRPLIVQSNSTGDARPVALVVHSTTPNDRVTLLHSGNEGRPLVLAHPPPLNNTTAQTRIRSVDAQTSHKMIGGVTLVGGNGSELTRLPGGAELNILPGVFRSVKSQPLTVQGGLSLSHTGISLQSSSGKSTSSVIQTTSSSDGIAHIVTQHSSLTGLTPMTVVSQGNQVTAHILGTSNLTGKMITTPLLKSVNQVPIVNAQYLNTTTLVKPVVVVTTSSNSIISSSSSSSIPSSTQPSVTSHSNV
ncbi:type-2 histone deacetylase 1-like isoform X3 [Aphidius gifuensis]|uniref:type-2 histone deacetylase 1-like isoform X3 n=1 Tax=Aphidius gifuensis TaxID=684658 RepID=UPI001CDD7C68|nr:type-2 histone deacetylase 1-like isoform X3 [Aphidius gifuensis]